MSVCELFVCVSVAASIVRVAQVRVEVRSIASVEYEAPQTN